MKKLLRIMILGLLWCNIGFAQELIKIPVHVHILEINEKRYKTKTKPKHVEVHFKKANKIWSKANIFWDLKKIDYIPADTTNFKSNVEWIYKHPRNKKNNANKEISKRKFEIYQQLLQIKRNQKHSHINVYYIPYVFELMCGFMQGFSKSSPKHEYLLMGHIMNPKYRIDNYYCKVWWLPYLYNVPWFIIGGLFAYKGATKLVE